ncbi:MAG TPA: phosphotransferase family protein [Candidatus Binataceae bacterium]|nr:phosphotransferase family protein [Candidatus Binataceae bacterium]
MSAADADETIRQLTALCRAKTADPDASISEIRALPGHAGFSYGFVLEYKSAGVARREKLVIRLAPAGVRISGTADVVRQARVMESLAGTDVPVPPVKWYDYDPAWFGRPFYVVGFIEGHTLLPENPQLDPKSINRLAREGIHALFALHRLDWRPRAPVWGEPFDLNEEFKRLDYLLDRPTLDPEMVKLTPRLRERLRATIPPAPQIGLVHGDFQWSNLLMRQGELLAVIDWELSLIGAVMIDLGWFCMFCDPDSWVDNGLRPDNCLMPDEIIALYSDAARRDVTDEVRWFRALAGYRFGVITVFNLMLHRRGKRIDPLWEQIGRSGSRLFERALELLE